MPFDNHPANAKSSLHFRALKFILFPILLVSGTFQFLSLSAVGFVRCWSCFFILSFRNFSTVHFREMAEEAPELKRDSTMTVTAKVRERLKAREHPKNLSIRRFPGTRWMIISLFCLRKEHSFLKTKEKFTKMREQGRSKENSRKTKRKMLRAN